MGRNQNKMHRFKPYERSLSIRHTMSRDIQEIDLEDISEDDTLKIVYEKSQRNSRKSMGRKVQRLARAARGIIAGSSSSGPSDVASPALFKMRRCRTSGPVTSTPARRQPTPSGDDVVEVAVGRSSDQVPVITLEEGEVELSDRGCDPDVTVVDVANRVQNRSNLQHTREDGELEDTVVEVGRNSQQHRVDESSREEGELDDTVIDVERAIGAQQATARAQRVRHSTICLGDSTVAEASTDADVTEVRRVVMLDTPAVEQRRRAEAGGCFEDLTPGVRKAAPVTAADLRADYMSLDTPTDPIMLDYSGAGARREPGQSDAWRRSAVRRALRTLTTPLGKRIATKAHQHKPPVKAPHRRNAQRHNLCSGRPLPGPSSAGGIQFGADFRESFASMLSQRAKRPVIIDGPNIAYAHGLNQRFSVAGIRIALDFFQRRGHRCVVFIPASYMGQRVESDRHLLQDMYDKGELAFTPSRIIDGRRVNCYDDRYVIMYATRVGGVILSRDHFRDVASEREDWRRTIENRLLIPVFVGDQLMLPPDPMGRSGPSLEEYITFPPGEQGELLSSAPTTPVTPSGPPLPRFADVMADFENVPPNRPQRTDGATQAQPAMAEPRSKQAEVVVSQQPVVEDHAAEDEVIAIPPPPAGAAPQPRLSDIPLPPPLFDVPPPVISLCTADIGASAATATKKPLKSRRKQFLRKSMVKQQLNKNTSAAATRPSNVPVPLQPPDGPPTVELAVPSTDAAASSAAAATSSAAAAQEPAAAPPTLGGTAPGSGSDAATRAAASTVARPTTGSTSVKSAAATASSSTAAQERKAEPFDPYKFLPKLTGSLKLHGSPITFAIMRGKRERKKRRQLRSAAARGRK